MNIYMSVGDNNRIGSRGEHIFAARITQGFMFDVTFLGEKHETTDFCVEFTNNGKSYMFFVQVKTTQDRSSNKSVYIPLMSADDVKYLAGLPYPTYLAGVELSTESVYIIGIFDQTEKMSSVPKKHILSFQQKRKSTATLELLRDDVIRCWNELEPDMSKKQNFITMLK